MHSFEHKITAALSTEYDKHDGVLLIHNKLPAISHIFVSIAEKTVINVAKYCIDNLLLMHWNAFASYS